MSGRARAATPRLPAEAGSALVLVFGTLGSAALGMLYTLWAARTLGPTRSADFFGALFIVSLLGISLGPVGATVTRFVSVLHAKGAPEGITRLARRLLRIVALAGTLALGAACLGLPGLTSLLNFESALTVLLAGAVAVATVLASVPRGVLRGVQDFGGYSRNLVLEAGIRLALGFAFLGLVPSATAALVPYLIALAAAQGLAWRRMPPGSPQRAAAPDARALFGFAVPMFLMTACAAGFQSLDVLFVKHRFAAIDAGLYGAAGAFGRVFALLFTPFRILLLPVASALHARNHPADGALLRVSVYFLLLVAAPLVAVWLWSDALVIWMYGEPFASAAPLLAPMALSMIAGSLPILVGQALASAEHWAWLPIYFVGLAGEWIALLFVGGSPERVLTIALIAKGLTAGALLAHYVVWRLAWAAPRWGSRAPEVSG